MNLILVIFQYLKFCNFSSAQVIFMNEYDIIMKIKKNKSRFERNSRLGF